MNKCYKGILTFSHDIYFFIIIYFVLNLYLFKLCGHLLEIAWTVPKFQQKSRVPKSIKLSENNFILFFNNIPDFNCNVFEKFKLSFIAISSNSLFWKYTLQRKANFFHGKTVIRWDFKCRFLKILKISCYPVD